VHIDDDGDVLLVGRDRHLRGLDAEFEKAALQVVRAQGLEVGVELGARIAVGLGVPAEPAPRVEVEQVLERGFAERLVADDAHLLDARSLTFSDGEGQIDAVALHRRHRGHDLGTVETAVDVLALEFLLGAVGKGLVKRPPLGEANLAHAFLQRVLVELARAHEIHVGDRGALLDHDHEHIARGLEAHVLEQTQGIQGADGCSAFVVVVFVADPKGQ
jgi:hypothetical protein